MNIKGIDHIVLTTENIAECLDFYGRVLGLKIEEHGGRFSLHLGSQKVNIHQRPAEFLPAASYPLAGSLDLCFEAKGHIEDVRDALLTAGVTLERDIVTRHGARGEMKSLYLRDPDGNLVELGFYDA